MKRTRWYEGTQRPAYIGVYERMFSSVSYTVYFYSKWDGKEWLINSGDVDTANIQRLGSLSQNIPWRGLVK